MTFRDNLKAARKKAGLTQVELATATGISRMSICRYEDGTSEPTVSKLLTLCKVLGVTVSEMVGEDRMEGGKRRGPFHRKDTNPQAEHTERYVPHQGNTRGLRGAVQYLRKNSAAAE